MIVDCHTHIWSDARQLGEGGPEFLARQGLGEGITAMPNDHAAASQCADRTFVLGYRSAHLNAEIPNDFVAEYVASNPAGLIGIAGIDPTEPGAVEQAEKLLAQDEFRGLTISPAEQNYHPADSRAMKLYEMAESLGAPVLFQQGTHFPMRGCMEYARPLLLDEIAREFPKMTIVVSSLGLPWVAECIALLGKHPRVFADVAGLVRRPWQAYNALLLAHQFNVMDKVLFGSDFPYLTAAEAIETLYRLHEVTQGTNLPGVPREVLRSMVERDAVGELGIARPTDREPARPEHELQS